MTRPYLNLLMKPRIFFRFSGKNIILCILKGVMPFKMHKTIFFGSTSTKAYKHWITLCERNSYYFTWIFLYPATKVWRGIMLYPSVSVRLSVRPSVRLSVRPSVRPCSPFPIDNLSIYSQNFFKFCIHIVIGDEWCGIVNGQNPSIFNGVTALFRIGKMVSGLLFLYCS